MTNTVELIKEFHLLPIGTESERLKGLNLYIRKVKQIVQHEQDLKSYANFIEPKNALEDRFKIEILLQLGCTDQILESLKSADVVATKKIVGNKKFIADAFSNMPCEIFFSTIALYVAHGTLLKIINRLSIALTDKNLACEYFNALLEKYDIHLAGKVLLACDIVFIRNVVEKYAIRLTSKELLTLAREDKDFLRFYFNVMWTHNVRVRLNGRYDSVLRFIGKTDADFFWKLYQVYKFNRPNLEIVLGEDVFINLFSDNEIKTTDRDICVDMFKPREIFNSLIKRDKLHILLANFCHGDEDEFYEIYSQNESRLFYSLHYFLQRAPKYRYFHYLNKAYNLKFGKDLVDNPNLFNEDLLKLTPKDQREIILNVLTLENPNLFYLYDIEKSIPILKGRLETDKDNTDTYLRQLYETCRFHRNEKLLLEVLNYIVEKYRHRETIVHKISEGVICWPSSEKLSPEIWKAVDEIVKIIDYIDDVVTSSSFDLYLKNHIINSVTNGIPLDRFFKRLINVTTDGFMTFGTQTNSKIFYETACQLTNSMSKKTDLSKEVRILLHWITTFNKVNKTDEISLVHYGHLLEWYAKEGAGYGDAYIFAGALNNQHSSFHDELWKRVQNDYEIVPPAYVEKYPEEFVANIVLVNAKTAASLSRDNFKNFTFEMKREVANYCLDILSSDQQNAKRICVALILLSLVDQVSFLDVVKSNLTALHEVDDKKRTIKKTVSQCFLRITYSIELLSVILKIYEECKHKQYLGPIKSFFNKIPANEAKAIIKSLSHNPATHLRKLSLNLAKDSLDKPELYGLIKEMSERETDVEVNRSLYRKAFFLFLRNQDDSHWILLERTIESGGVDPKHVADFWAKLSQISAKYCEKYVLATLKAVTESTESAENNWKQRLLMLLPAGTQDKLNKDFLVSLLKEIPFHTARSRGNHYWSVSPKDNYHLESVFYTSCEKQEFILEFVLKELEEYITENWSDFPATEIFSNVYEFLRAFCKYTFKLKPKNGIVERFFLEWSRIFSTYTQPKFLMLEFLNAYSESQYEIEGFCSKSNEMLKSYVKKYGKVILNVFCDELAYFVDAARIYQFDFLKGFMKCSADPLTYSAIAMMLPAENGIYYTEQTSLKFLRDSLKDYSDKTVRLHLAPIAL